MFRNALEKTRRGVVACVFDTSDRVQHMFYRYPAPGQRRQRLSPAPSKTCTSAWTAWWAWRCSMSTRTRCLFVLSDHGFCSFRRGVNLNSWLRDQRLPGAGERRHGERPVLQRCGLEPHARLHLGLGGLYLNLKGREAQGIVAAGRRGRGTQTGTDRKASQPARHRAQRARNSQSIRNQCTISRSVSGRSARPDRRLQRRLSDVVGRGGGQGDGGGFRRQLARPGAAIIPWIPMLVPGVLFSQPQNRRDRSGNRGPGAHGAASFSEWIRPPGWKASQYSNRYEETRDHYDSR